MKRFVIASLLLSTLLTVTLASKAQASELRVRECQYNVHGATISEIRNDGYFENSVELKLKATNVWVGGVPLMAGYRLSIQVAVVNGRVQMRSSVHSGNQVALAMAGQATAAPGIVHSYKLSAVNKKADLAESGGTASDATTVFYRADVTCTLGPTRLGDRVFDLVD